jgi:cytochrome P450
VQSALQAELRSLDPPLRFPPSSSSSSSTGKLLPSAKAVDALPLLQATLQETLRLRAAIPGPEPRVTPVGGCVLGPTGEYRVPGGVRVSAQAHSLHRNGEVFVNPESWEPERWLKHAGDEGLREMNRWFWAFGSGGRMCVGSNLAIYREYSPCAMCQSWLLICDSSSRNEIHNRSDIYKLRDNHNR